MYTADQICSMIDFLVDNMSVKFGNCLISQLVGIPMATNCASLLADLFLYSYKSDFLDSLVRSGHRRLARSFSLCYRYIDDLTVLSNKTFIDYVKDIYPCKNVDKADRLGDQANYLDLTFIIGDNNRLNTNVIISTYPLSTFHSCQITYHLALYMMFTFCSLSDMQDAAHITMTLDICLLYYFATWFYSLLLLNNTDATSSYTSNNFICFLVSFRFINSEVVE